MASSGGEMRHEIRTEYMDTDFDQPLGWIVVCSCGEKFDHCAPEGAKDAHRRHQREEAERGV